MSTNEPWPQALLSWFAANRRDLPWREAEPRNPYHVWVSEIMLQQTRTETVKPYFNAWMERFPTIAALAAADEAEVLHAWQGLGYYSRARNLHRAALDMVERFNGELPCDGKALRNLPGIGDYTAGAILSIGFGKRAAAIDGNVLRVYARLYDVEEDVLKPAGKKAIASLVEETLPDEAGPFNEALMDLGSLICIPKNPRCGQCPLAAFCQAFREGKAEELPHRTKKKPQKEEYAACAICIQDGKVLLHKRPAKGMLANMWEFPMALAADGAAAAEALAALLGAKLEAPLWHHTHVFTHRIWHMNAYPAGSVHVPAGEYRWFTPAEYREIPLAGPHARLAAFVEKLV